MLASEPVCQEVAGDEGRDEDWDEDKDKGYS
jgi:hypothetical protein